MNTPDLYTNPQQTDINSVVDLLFGLNEYLQDKRRIPVSLRRAVNKLTFAQADLPRTLFGFLELCHQPLSGWYPLPLPNDFNPSQPILYSQSLSEEAQDFCQTLAEQLDLPALAGRAIAPETLDNYQMIVFRRQLKEWPDSAEAQSLYVQVRSFLIEHDWATEEQLRQSRQVLPHLRGFYEDIPAAPPHELLVCDRCGMLEWRQGAWHGIKPSYCSDHGLGSPLVHAIPNTGRLLRLKRGIHLRTFIPGRLELALFFLAEKAQASYPDYLQSVERYPGLDTYDLRLNFTDETWAVDAKDHRSPERLASQIQPLYSEDELFHTRAFYVIPDRHFNDVNYHEQLELRTQGVINPSLQITSLSVFQQRVEEKLETLAKPPRRRNNRRG